METREKVNINIRLGRQAFAGLAGAELPSFDHGPWKRVPRPQTVEVTDDHHESVEAEAADDRDGTPTLPSMEIEDPQAAAAMWMSGIDYTGLALLERPWQRHLPRKMEDLLC